MCRFHTVYFRHHMIHKNKVVCVAGDFFNGILGTARRINLHLQRFQQSGGNGQVHGIVIYNQYRRFRCGKVEWIFVFLGQLRIQLLVKDACDI